MYIKYAILEWCFPEWKVDSLTVSSGVSSSYSLGPKGGGDRGVS